VTVGQAAPGLHTKGAKPLSISQGQEVNLADFLVTGRMTLFDFTSEYCAPCRGFDEVLYQVHRQRADVAVVKVDINRPEVHKIDWQSPVALQYGMQSVPYFKIYGADGQLIAEGRPARTIVEGWISQLH
jgi:thiol-disulfide isomerase/thioredoxin